VVGEGGGGVGGGGGGVGGQMERLTKFVKLLSGLTVYTTFYYPSPRSHLRRQ